MRPIAYDCIRSVCKADVMLHYFYLAVTRDDSPPVSGITARETISYVSDNLKLLDPRLKRPKDEDPTETRMRAVLLRNNIQTAANQMISARKTVGESVLESDFVEYVLGALGEVAQMRRSFSLALDRASLCMGPHLPEEHKERYQRDVRALRDVLHRMLQDAEAREHGLPALAPLQRAELQREAYLNSLPSPGSTTSRFLSGDVHLDAMKASAEYYRLKSVNDFSSSSSSDRWIFWDDLYPSAVYNGNDATLRPSTSLYPDDIVQDRAAFQTSIDEYFGGLKNVLSVAIVCERLRDSYTVDAIATVLPYIFVIAFIADSIFLLFLIVFTVLLSYLLYYLLSPLKGILWIEVGKN